MIGDERDYTRSGDGEWWYRDSAVFVTEYARTNPREDFAESFAAYFMLLADRDFRPGVGAEAIPDKIDFMATWLS